MIYPVVLSGGSGTRLWPMSRTLYPKQLLTLLGRDSLLQQTVRRVADDRRFAAPLLVANEEHRFIIAEQLREIAVVPHALLLEPIGRNTAPAACVAALALTEIDPDPLMLVMPSDHTISDVGAFLAAVDLAASEARNGALVGFGVAPERVETGYGYIRRGSSLETEGVSSVTEFVEKPGPEAAKQYLASGEYCWNSGIFLFPARLYIDELERLRPGHGCRLPAIADQGTARKRLYPPGQGCVFRLRWRFDRLCSDGKDAARRRRAGCHGVERRRVMGRPMGDERQRSRREFDRRQRRRRGHPQLLSEIPSWPPGRDWHPGPRRRRDCRCSYGGAAQPHAGRQETRGSASQRASR